MVGDNDEVDAVLHTSLLQTIEQTLHGIINTRQCCIHLYKLDPKTILLLLISFGAMLYNNSHLRHQNRVHSYEQHDQAH